MQILIKIEILPNINTLWIVFITYLLKYCSQRQGRHTQMLLCIKVEIQRNRTFIFRIIIMTILINRIYFRFITNLKRKFEIFFSNLYRCYRDQEPVHNHYHSFCKLNSQFQPTKIV